MVNGRNYTCSFTRRAEEERNSFLNKLKAEQREQRKREVALLKKPHEVKRLSELLRLDLMVNINTALAFSKALSIRHWTTFSFRCEKQNIVSWFDHLLQKDEDSVTAGSEAGFEAALRSAR